VPDAGEHVVEFPRGRRGVTNTIGRKKRQGVASGDTYHFLVTHLFFPVEVTLQLGVDVVFSKNGLQPLYAIGSLSDL
jgi:hypothetical protein